MPYSTVMEYMEKSLDFSLMAEAHLARRKHLFRFAAKPTPANVLARDAHFYAANHLEETAQTAWDCVRLCGTLDVLP